MGSGNGPPRGTGNEAKLFRQDMDGRLGTPLQSFASVARTFEGAEGLPPQSPEKCAAAGANFGMPTFYDMFCCA